MKRLSVLLLTCSICSCDPGFSVILSNSSNKDRIVRVIEKDQRKFDRVQAVSIANTPDSVYSSQKKAVLIEKDSNTKSYTFILEQGKSVLLQGGIGFPDYEQRIILDTHDTILMKKDHRVKTKKKFMGTYLTIVSE